MLREAERLILEPFDRYRLALLRELSSPDEHLDLTALCSAADAAQAACGTGDVELARDVLLRIAMRCFTLAPGARGDLPERLLAAVAGAREHGEDARQDLTEALADPVLRGAGLATALERWKASEPIDGRAGWMLGLTATLVWDAEAAVGLLNPAIRDLRGRDVPVPLLQAVLSRGWSRFHLGHLEQAELDATETIRTADEAGLVHWAASGHGLLAVIAAIRGEVETVRRHANLAERFAIASGTAQTLAHVQLARGHEALGAGRYEEAFDQLIEMWDSAGTSGASELATWAIGDLVEAAVHCDRLDEVGEAVAKVEAICASMPAPELGVGLSLARALMAKPEQVEGAFLTALGADLTRRPFSRARLQLAWGTWLRRQRRLVESRGPLATARAAFTALEATPWAEKARHELRGAGVTSHSADGPAVASDLTPQELEIARLAASGLSNRDIGRQLYLSHRTVGAHLYRIFPKLGITSRVQLRDALEQPAS